MPVDSENACIMWKVVLVKGVDAMVMVKRVDTMVMCEMMFLRLQSRYRGVVDELIHNGFQAGCWLDSSDKETSGSALQTMMMLCRLPNLSLQVPGKANFVGNTCSLLADLQQ